MTNWLFFALLAQLLWGLSYVLDGALRRHFVKSDMALMWIMAFLRLPFVIVLLLIFGIEVPSKISFLFMLLAGALWAIPLFFYCKALKEDDPSRVALLMQLIPVFTLVIAFFVLQERLTTMQGVAFILLISGGVFASMKRLRGAWHLSKVLFLMIFATFLWANANVLFKKFAIHFSSFFTAFPIFILGVFLTSLLMIVYSGSRKRILRHFDNQPLRAWLMIVSTVVAGIVGSMSLAYALTLGKASLTSVITGIQPLFVLSFGLLLAPFIKEILKEDLSKRALLLKGVSFVLILIGLMFLEL